jgi:hypothetical protein
VHRAAVSGSPHRRREIGNFCRILP